LILKEKREERRFQGVGCLAENNDKIKEYSQIG
jgi:hypothetical protein